jgi:hypothetical protein
MKTPKLRKKRDPNEFEASKAFVKTRFYYSCATKKMVGLKLR